jgi:DNA-binding CsgD family transcriptional regulator
LTAAKHFREPLTLRQLQYLAHAANGLTFDEIADREYVTRDAVKSSFSEARKRCDARNVTHLVALAVSLGLIVYEDDGYSTASD